MARAVLLGCLSLALAACGSDPSTATGTDAGADTIVAPIDGGPGDDTTAPFDGARDTLVDRDSSTIDSAPIPTDATAAYPAGPYGATVGNVIADLDLEGYVRFDVTTGIASSVAYGATSFGDLRAKSPKKYAVLHVSGFT